MADIVILPPSQVHTVSTGGPSQTATDAAKPSSSPLTPGSQISGTVTRNDGNGNYLLRTSSGTVALHSDTPLTYNSDVVLSVGGNGAAGGTNARILSVNGEPFSTFSSPDATSTEDTVSPTILAQVAATTGEAGTPAPAALPGIIVTPPAAADTQNAGGEALSQGTTAQGATDASSAAFTSGTSVIIRATQAAEPQQAFTTGQASALPQNNPASTGQQVTPRAPAPQTAAPPTPQNVSSSTQPVAAAAVAETETANAVSQAAAIVTTAAAADHAEPASPVASAVTEAAAAAPSTVTAAAANTAPALASEEQVAAPAASPAPATAVEVATASPAAVASPAATPAAAPGQGAPSTAQPPIPAPAAATSQNATALYAAYRQAPTTPTLAALASAPSDASVKGQVVTVTPEGLVNIATPGGTVFTVRADPAVATSVLAPGSDVSVELATTATANAVASQAAESFSSTPATLSQLAGAWETLGSILTQLKSTNPTAASSLLAKLPQLDGSFSASTLGFIGTLGSGNLRKLLGDEAVDTLQQQGAGSLLDKLSGEVATVAGAVAQGAGTRQPVQGWQTLVLPFVFQGEIEQARIFVKREAPKKDRGATRTTDDTRFIVEVSLSELGPLQADGLVRKKESATAFDLVIRSRRAFSPREQAEMTAIYNDAAELTGFTGSIGFQAVREFAVKPLGETPHNHPESFEA